MRWNACVYRLDLGLYSHLKELLKNGVRTHNNSKGKIPPNGGSEEVWTRAAASRRTVSPIHYQLRQSYSSPDFVSISRISSIIGTIYTACWLPTRNKSMPACCLPWIKEPSQLLCRQMYGTKSVSCYCFGLSTGENFSFFFFFILFKVNLQSLIP